MNNKFKVWCKNNNEWEKDGIVCDEYGVLYEINQSGRLRPISNGTTHIKVNCTGIKDKNGKLIFEGDILEAVDRIVKVRWNENFGCWDSDWVAYKGELISNGITTAEWPRRAKIIGNIFEHPGLMEELKYSANLKST